VVLNAIQEQKFDLITTGLQEYPEDVKREVAKHYYLKLLKKFRDRRKFLTFKYL